MSDFVRVKLPNGAEALFQPMESDLVSLHTGESMVDDMEAAGARLEAIAEAANEIGVSLRRRLAPEEMSLEIGIGLSGEVGWFFARSTAEGSLKVTLTWTHSLKDK